MKRQVLILLLALLFAASCTQAQNLASFYFGFPQVTQGTNVLPNAWAGGVNAALTNRIDLNGDNLEDLLIYDKTSRRVFTFIAQASPSLQFTYAPAFEQILPPIKDWVITRDYNGDGKKDIFTGAPDALGLGNNTVVAYRNTTTAGGNLTYATYGALYTTLLCCPGKTPLTVQATDIPAITDMNGDGDLDFLFFEFSGQSLEYDKNMSMDLYGHRDSLVFVKKTNCWGGITAMGSCGSYSFSACNIDLSPGGRVAHNGATVFARDLNGDGAIDLLLGDVGCNSLTQVNNLNNNANPAYGILLPNFPASSPTKASFYLFPAVFEEDFDGDGIKDMLAIPNIYSDDGLSNDFTKTMWLFKNTGTNALPVYNYITNTWLQDGMLDFGLNTAPAFADIDADGVLDLVAGCRGRNISGSPRGSLAYLRNTGMVNGQPSFQVINTNYLGFNSGDNLDTRPYFTDYNGDGAIDFAYITTPGSTGITVLKVRLNQSAAGQPCNFGTTEITLPVTLDNSSSVAFVDIDQDGKTDILASNAQGRIAYYRNTGSAASPVYTLANSQYGNIQVACTGNCYIKIAVADVDGNGTLDLAASVSNGGINFYSNVRAGGTLTASTTWLRSSATAAAGLYALDVFNPLAFADLNGDGMPEMVTGSAGGGFRFFYNTQLVPAKPRPITTRPLQVYPNPANSVVYINLPGNGSLVVYDAGGRQVLTRQYYNVSDLNVQVPLAGMANGLYTLHFTNGQAAYTARLVVNH